MVPRTLASYHGTLSGPGEIEQTRFYRGGCGDFIGERPLLFPGLFPGFRLMPPLRRACQPIRFPTGHTQAPDAGASPNHPAHVLQMVEGVAGRV